MSLSQPATGPTGEWIEEAKGPQATTATHTETAPRAASGLLDAS